MFEFGHDMGIRLVARGFLGMSTPCGTKQRSCTSQISSDDEVTHGLRGLAHGDVGQDLVEKLDLVAPRLVLYDSTILPEDPEFEVPHIRFHHKWRAACRRRKLPQRAQENAFEIKTTMLLCSMHYLKRAHDTGSAKAST